MGLVEPSAISTLLPPNESVDYSQMSDQQLLSEKAKLGLEDPYFFVTEILKVGKEDDLPRAEEETRPILEWFDQPRPEGFPKKRRFLIYWSSSRFTAKTTCCAAIICRKIIVNPNTAWLIQCEEKKMAIATVEVIRDWLESPEIEQLYGKFKNTKNWGSEAFTVRQRTVKRRDPTVQASGLDVPMQSWHPDGVWWDDLIGEQNNNLEGYKKAEKKVAAAMPVLRQDGMGIYTCTRWGPDDPAGKILKQAERGGAWMAPQGRGFFGAYAVEGDEEFFPHAVEGEPLFKSILPEEEIEFYREEWPYDVFCAQILNTPISEEGQEFHGDSFQHFDPFQEDGRWIEELQEGAPYMAFDPAGGKEQAERGDRSAMGVGFVRWKSKNAQLWMVEARGGRWSTQKCYDSFFSLVEKWRPRKIFIEKNKGEEWLLDPLRKRASAMGITLPLETVHWGKGDAKKDRIKALVDPYTYKQVYHAKYLKNTQLEIELLQWRPGGKTHDDFADMEAMLWLKATKSKGRGKRGIKVGRFNRREHPRYARTGI